MSALLPFITLNQNCEQVQAWANQQLVGAGFRVVQTFDLQVARLAHPDCTCPNHGTDECNCQMVILLVYPKRGNPITLVIHGQEDRTWLSLAVPDSGRGNQRLEATIHRLLQTGAGWLPPIDVAYEDAESTI